jgi:hypothetical protein
MPPQLHAALFDIILDELGYDDTGDGAAGRALQACALASSILRPRSQHHLFRSMYVTGSSQSSKLRAVTLENESLAQQVRVLRIIGRVGEVGHSGWVFEQAPSSLAGLLPLLPKVQHIVLQGVDYASEIFNVTHDSIGALRVAMPHTVSELTCVECAFSQDVDLVAILHTIGPRLKTLDMQWTYWLAEQADPAAVFEMEFELEKLSINHAYSEDVDVYLIEPTRPWLTSITTSRLTNLTLMLVDSDDVIAWQKVVDRAHQLHTLSIHALSDAHDVLLNLSSCSALRSLVMSTGEQWDYRESDRDMGRIGYLLQIAQSATNATLDSITLDVREPPSWLPWHMPWLDLTQVVDTIQWAVHDAGFALELHTRYGLSHSLLKQSAAEIEREVRTRQIRRVKVHYAGRYA